MSITFPAEWAPHRAMWVGFPSDAELWQDDLEPAQDEVAALARALADPGGERVRLLVSGDDAVKAAKARLDGCAGVEIVRGLFGDIWLRDTGPIFVQQGDKTHAAGFKFNGWGGKYVLDYDDQVAEQIAAASGTPLVEHDFILEGGALDTDGFGTFLTTRQCLLNRNRNPGWTEEIAQAKLAEALGCKKLLWLGDGLLNDHTDGHVDNLARFVSPGVAACPIGYGRYDLNGSAYDDAAERLAGFKDARGRNLQVVRIPSPGRTEGPDGRSVPASHMNFVIANDAVIVPTYDDERAGQFAIEAVQSLFPERKVVGLPARRLLTGGGSFHCITQQEPA